MFSFLKYSEKKPLNVMLLFFLHLKLKQIKDFQIVSVTVNCFTDLVFDYYRERKEKLNSILEQRFIENSHCEVQLLA